MQVIATTRTGLWSIAALLLALVANAQTAPESRPKSPKGRPFLKARFTRLYLGNTEFRNVGVNIPDLFERFLRGNDASAIQSLESAQALGVRHVRCFGVTWGPDDFGLFETDRARWLAAYDKMLDAADKAGIALVPSLLFNINMLPGYVRRKTSKDEQVVDYLTPGSASNKLAVAYVTAIVSRYKDDPRILFWEIGNEYNLEADLSAQRQKRPANQIPTSDHIQAFLIQIATLIKRLDKKHLVTSGNSEMRPAAWHLRQAMLAHRSDPDPLDYPMDWSKDFYEQYVEILTFFNPPPLDILSVHHYPLGDDPPRWLLPNDDYAFQLPWTRAAADRLGKPLFVGEVGQKVFVDGKEQAAPWINDFLKRIVGEAAPLATLWSWEFDKENPMQAPYSLSAERAPNLVRAITEVNTALRRAIEEKARSQGRP